MIKSAEEQRFLEDKLNELALKQRRQVWIGLTDRQKDGPYLEPLLLTTRLAGAT